MQLGTIALCAQLNNIGAGATFAPKLIMLKLPEFHSARQVCGYTIYAVGAELGLPNHRVALGGITSTYLRQVLKKRVAADNRTSCD